MRSVSTLLILTLGAIQPGYADDFRAATYDVSEPFHSVYLKSLGDFVINQGTEQSLVVEADAAVQKLIQAEVDEGQLVIDISGSVQTDSPVTYYVTVKDLNLISFTSTGTVRVEQLRTPALKLEFDGSGDINIASLDTRDFEGNFSGAGTVTVRGKAGIQSVHLDGAVDYLAGNFFTERADVTLTGAGDADIYVSKVLTSYVSGSGTLRYSGSPQIIDAKVSLGTVVSDQLAQAR